MRMIIILKFVLVLITFKSVCVFSQITNYDIYYNARCLRPTISDLNILVNKKSNKFILFNIQKNKLFGYATGFVHDTVLSSQKGLKFTSIPFPVIKGQNTKFVIESYFKPGDDSITLSINLVNYHRKKLLPFIGTKIYGQSDGFPAFLDSNEKFICRLKNKYINPLDIDIYLKMNDDSTPNFDYHIILNPQHNYFDISIYDTNRVQTQSDLYFAHRLEGLGYEFCLIVNEVDKSSSGIRASNQYNLKTLENEFLKLMELDPENKSMYRFFLDFINEIVM